MNFQYGYYSFQPIDDSTCYLGIQNNKYANCPIEGKLFSGPAIIPGFVRNPHNQRVYKVVETALYAFRDCIHLTNITLPNTIHTINRDLLYNTSVTYLTIPASVRCLTYAALSGLSSLTTLIFQPGSELTTLKESSFAYFHSANLIILPPKLRTINRKLFEYRVSSTPVTLIFCGTHQIPSSPLTEAETTIVAYVSSRYRESTIGGIQANILEDDSICMPYFEYFNKHPTCGMTIKIHLPFSLCFFNIVVNFFS